MQRKWVWTSLSLVWILSICFWGCSQQPAQRGGTGSSGKAQRTAVEQPQQAAQQPAQTKQSATSSEQKPSNTQAKTSQKASGTGETETAQKQEKPTSQETAQRSAKRTSLEGRWILTLSQNGRNFKALLLEFKPAGNKDGKPVFEAQLLEKTRVLPPVKLKSAELVGKHVHLVFSIQDETLDFLGVLQNGVVKGNVLVAQVQCEPALLVATDLTSLKGQREAVLSPAFSELRKLVQSPQPLEKIDQFYESFKDEPTAVQAYALLLQQAGERHWSTEQVQKLAQRYIQRAAEWGKRFQQIARINVPILLADAKYDSEFTLKLLKQVEKEVSPDILKNFQEQLNEAKQAIQIEHAMKLVESNDPAKRRQGAQVLEELIKKHPFNFAALYALARCAEKDKQLDKAIELYAEVAVLPFAEQILMSQWGSAANKELPSEAVARLWKKKHGSTKGLEQFLDKVYTKHIYGFVEKQKKPQPAKNKHIVLCELLTGSQCPPCVAADIALGGIEKTYPDSEVVVLRYHQHIPGPDPFANPDTQARFRYYRAMGTPTLAVDGRLVSGVGGLLIHVPRVYERIRAPIDKLLQQPKPKHEIEIKLKAQAQNGVLNVTAEVVSNKPLPKTVRLRTVLAEDEISYVAKNGVRRHEMIVRAMLGGAEGVAPQNGKLQLQASLNLNELKKKLKTYLEKIEKQRGYHFPAKPLKMEALHVVAFVQDDQTHEIWQTAIVPVTGALTKK